MFKKVLWYFLRPKYYKQFFLKIFRRFKENLYHNNHMVALKWCEKNAVSTQEALLQITKKKNHIPLNDIYVDVFNYANKQERTCPSKMGGSANLELIYYIIDFFKSKKIIETGVAYGWSTLAILLSISKRDGAKLISIDMPYPGLNNSKYVGCVIKDALKDKWHLIRDADKYALTKALGQFAQVDLCHYDSDKYYSGRMWAYLKMWKALKKGGVLISDDIENNLAFKEFSDSVDRKPIIVAKENLNKTYNFQYAGIIIK